MSVVRKFVKVKPHVTPKSMGIGAAYFYNLIKGKNLRVLSEDRTGMEVSDDEGETYLLLHDDVTVVDKTDKEASHA